MMKKAKRKLSAWQFITLGYLVLILLGSLLLTTPLASREGTWTSFLDALFTATSATCVTGLVVVDTFTHWSLFGQVVILLLIQTGGLGFMTVLTMVLVMLRRNVGLYQRQVIMQSVGNLNLSGSVALILRILRGTFLIEAAGAALLAVRFCGEFGLGTGLYYAVFHAVSAFCNAGFDLMGRRAPFSSLTYYVDDPLVCLTICVLILLGGLGFLVWSDLLKCKWHVKRYTLHTRIALCATAVLVIIPTALFHLYEGQGFLPSLFAAITPRTAGFNTIDLSNMSSGGYFLTTVLMFIGGNSGSTAGGVKITTAVVVLYCVFAGARRSEDIVVGGRQLDSSIVREATATLGAYLLLTCAGSLVIAGAESYSLTQILLEVVSAIATVGLTTGITPTLTAVSRCTLIFLMFAGRLGVMTLAIAFGQRRNPPPLRRPTDKILIG